MTRHLSLALAALLLAALAVPSPAPAQDATTMRACVKKKNGAMRLLAKPTAKCRKSERLVNWNATGVQGLPGAKGDPGEKGDPGPIAGTPAGGALTGTFPNPMIADGAVGAGQIAAALIDPESATPGLRSLGTGGQQAAAGNDPRLSDARTPTGPAGGGLAGTYPNPTIAPGAIGSDQVDDRSLRLVDTSVIVENFVGDLPLIPAASCFTQTFEGILPTQVGDIQAIAVPQDLDPRLHAPTVAIRTAGSVSFRLCTGGEAVDPPHAVYPFYVTRRADPAPGAPRARGAAVRELRVGG